MGIGDFFKEVGDGISHAASNWWQGVEKGFEGGYKAGSETGDTINSLPVIKPTVEGVSSAYNWLYSNGVSQPISTAMLMGNAAAAPGHGGMYFSGSAWTKAWHAANYVSPGQANLLSSQDSLKAINSPLTYYQPATSFLPPGFDKLSFEAKQRALKAAGMPAVGNQTVEEQRRKNPLLFNTFSGATDLAVSMGADPTIAAGKAFSVIKDAKIRQVRPEGGWSGQQISDIMASSKMKRAINWIWANKDNPQLLNNSELARHSALGPRFGAIVSTLQDPGEVGLFVRTGLGDVEAQRLLTAQNKLAAARIEAPTSRLAGLQSRLAATEDPRMQAVVQSEIDRLNDARSADQAMYDRYNAILDHADEIDQLNIHRWSFADAEKRTQAQNAYRMGPALGRKAADMQPGSGGFSVTKLFGQDGYFGGPVTLVRMLKNAKPNGFVDINDLTNDAINEVRGHLARIPGIDAAKRQQILNDFIKAPNEGGRKDILLKIGALGIAKIAQKYGLTSEEGAALYAEHMRRQDALLEGLATKFTENQRFTGALNVERTAEKGHAIYLDELPGEGGEITVTPFTATRLMNSHVLPDLDAFDKVLSRSSGELKTLRLAAGNAQDWVVNAADHLSYLWKFSTLFRLGYIPRVMSDDLAGQVARLGAAAMAARVKWGIKNGATNAAMWVEKQGVPARMGVAQEGLKYAEGELARLSPGIERLRNYGAAQRASNAQDLVTAQQRVDRVRQLQRDLPTAASQAQVNALQQLFDKRILQLQQAQRRAAVGSSPGKAATLAQMEDQASALSLQAEVARQRIADLEATLGRRKVVQGNQPLQYAGESFAPALGADFVPTWRGNAGNSVWVQRTSSSDAISHIFEDNRRLIQTNLERSFQHGSKPITAAQDSVAHAEAWTHAINNVIMQDPAQSMIVREGWDIPRLVKWMKDEAPGRAYRDRLPKMVATEDLARSMKMEVDSYLHTPEIRAKALEPGGVDPKFLQEATPHVHDRPQVHIGQLHGVSLEHANALDQVIQFWYKVAAQIPADRMSRHPLFNQFYEGHVKRITNSRIKQGAWAGHTVDDVNHITEAARRLAHKDMRKLVFDIAHRSDASAALRFMSPFFTATAEAFQRWGRILADRPQVAGYAAKFYNAPVAVGAMQDADGNHIMPDGTIVDPVTGKRQLVPKSDRYIVVRMPKALSDAFGYGDAPGHLRLSQNSMNLITQGDPWFNPGMGPVVQIPVDQFVADKPKAAEIATELGITPFGPSGKGVLGATMNQFTPTALRNFLTAYDTSDERYQQVKLQIMQQAAFEHATLGKPMPSAQQIADRVKSYWKFTAASAFLQPMATQRADAYQFYRDQYNNLRRANPLTADDEYLKRFGESYFVFAQATSKNTSGLPATMDAVELSRKYGDLIATSPELAALIVGPQGKGPFSPTAYAYELNNPLSPGDADMIRTKMSANDAMKENQRRLGWAQFTKAMNELTGQLHAQGFQSFSDPGAEQLAALKRGYSSALAEPLMPDGTVNPNYNAEWSKDWYSFDARKYDRLIPAMIKVATSDLARNPHRTDLVVLQTYLGARQELMRQLSSRKAAGGSAALNAQSNADLSDAWVRTVDALVESDTKFGDLYHRYLQRDMGVNAAPRTSEEAA